MEDELIEHEILRLGSTFVTETYELFAFIDKN